MKANLVNEMYSQKHEMKKDLEQSQKKSEELKARLSQLFTVLPKLAGVVRQQKDSLKNLRQQATQQKQLTRDQMNTVRNRTEKAFQKVAKKVCQLLLEQRGGGSNANGTHLCTCYCNL